MTNQRQLRTELIKVIRTVIWKNDLPFPVTATLQTGGFGLMWTIDGISASQLREAGMPNGRALATTFVSQGIVTPAGIEHSGLFPLRITSPIEGELRGADNKGEIKFSFRSDPPQPAEVEMQGDEEDDQWEKIGVTTFLVPIEDTNLATGGLLGDEDVRIVAPKRAP
jgi:hypothetical protein